MAAAESLYEGAGGKLRRKPFRRATTPYDRPPSAIRNHTEAGRNSWFLKIVDPASRIITASAQRLFSSFFRKSLLAPQSIPESNCEARDAFPEAVSFNPSSGEQEQVYNQDNNLGNSSDSSGVNELEQILKQKTFTRAEIDHLTELLHSRTVNLSAEDDKKRSEPSMSQQAAAHDQQELGNIPLQENGMKHQSLHESISVPVVLEEDVASPAELAKAYMGSRSSKVTPSTIGLHNQAFREDVSWLNNAPFPPKSPSMSLAPRSAVRFANVPGASESGFLTPVPRCRSGIYSVPRTQYSSVHHTSTHKGVGSPLYGSVGPSTCSQWLWENNTLSSDKQVSKRKNSVLDCDIGSIGPMRRIRRKTNMISPSKNMRLPSNSGSPFIPVTMVGSDSAQGSTPLIQESLMLDGPKHHTSARRLGENGDNSIPGKDFASVPSQSTEMAQKILQQLDKLVPSPKEKSSELKLSTARAKSPTNIMPPRQALRSMEDLDSSKLMQNIKGTGTLDGLDNSNVSRARDSSSQKQFKVAENSPFKITVLADKLAPEANGVATLLSVKDSILSTNNMDSGISNFVANPIQKKQNFQRSAHEESLQLDDNNFSSKVGSTPVVEKEKLDVSLVERNAITSETIHVEKHPVSTSKPTANFILKETTSTQTYDATLVAEKDLGFTFPTTPVPSTTTQPDVPILQSSTLFNRPSPPKEQTAAPMFSSGVKSVDNAATFSFSSSSSDFSGCSGLTFGAQSGSNLHALSSISVAATTEFSPSMAESDKSNKDKTQKAGDAFSLPENATSTVVSASATHNIFSFGGSTSYSSLHNGSVSSPSPFSASAPPVSTRSTSDIFFSNATPTAATTNMTTSSRSNSAATSTSTVPPIFQFGSSISAASSLSNSAVFPSEISTVDSAASVRKTEQASPVTSPNKSPFGATSAAFTDTDSRTSVFGASAPSSFTTARPPLSGNSQFQSPNTSTNGSVFDTCVAPGTGVAQFTQRMPKQFGSSALSPAFGLNGSSTFSSGSSLFGSSSPGANSFGSCSDFGLNSSMNSTIASSFSSNCGTTSLFGSGTPSAASSIFSGFGSTSSAMGFSFGLSSAAAVTTSSAPLAIGSSFGASSGSIFSFTSSSATTSTASPSPSLPVLKTPNVVSTFGSASSGNEQMNMDSVADDAMKASTPVFSEPANSVPPSNFILGSPAPPGGSPLFQFSSQQNPSPFQVSGNLGFSAGGNFALGTGGVDKSNRKIVKVRRDKWRKR